MVDPFSLTSALNLLFYAQVKLAKGKCTMNISDTDLSIRDLMNDQSRRNMGSTLDLIMDQESERRRNMGSIRHLIDQSFHRFS